MKTFTKEMQQVTSPQNALDLLKEGNIRFTSNTNSNRNYLEQAVETQDGQYPYAVILSCIDSRASSELIFDQGIGDIFSIRIAGNIINDDILGSMEFACKAAGSKLIVVLGHTQCGAVKGACDDVELGHLTTLLNKIKPLVESESSTDGDKTSSNSNFILNVTKINVNNSIKEILSKSEVLNDMVNNGDIKIIGGMHNIATGEVTFF